MQQGGVIPSSLLYIFVYINIIYFKIKQLKTHQTCAQTQVSMWVYEPMDALYISKGAHQTVLFCAPRLLIGTDRIPSRHPISTQNPLSFKWFRSDSERILSGKNNTRIPIGSEWIILRYKLIEG